MNPVIAGGGTDIANLANYRATEDWWFILPAILFVDVFIIFLCRFFPKTFGKPINDWYDEFGLTAVLSDVMIIAIGIAIARYIYSVFFMESEGWSIFRIGHRAKFKNNIGENCIEVSVSPYHDKN